MLAKIAEMPGPYRDMGQRLHALILQSVPALKPRLWYGMPAYAKGGKVVCFSRVDRYTTFGLTEDANLGIDEGTPQQLIGSSWYIISLESCAGPRAQG